MKTLPILATALVAILSLSACKPEPEVIGGRPADPNAEKLKNAPPVELPPSIAASVSFRCQPGNTLAFVDFMKGDKIAVLKTEKGAMGGTTLRAPEAGQPFVAEGGYKITGDAKAATIEAPGVGTKTCKA